MGKIQGLARVVAPTLQQVSPKARDVAWWRAAQQRPKLAIAAAKVISEFSLTEAAISNTFAYMLGIGTTAGAAMYQALGTWAPRRDAMEAVARTALPAEAADVWSAILFIFKTRAEERNPIAHHIWGYTPSLPHSLLTCDPKHFFDTHAANSVYMARRRAGLPVGARPPSPSERIDPKHIRVYRVRDFDKFERRSTTLTSTLRNSATTSGRANCLTRCSQTKAGATDGCA